MIKKNTVFVLGAGASIAYGFPSGATLVDEILDSGLIMNLTYDHEGNKSDERPFSREHVANFLRDLGHSDHYSIDAYLRHRPEFLDVGKAAIALHIGGREDPSFLQRPHLKKIENWYAELFHQFLASESGSFSANNVTFVTFNYDRSLEEYFFKAIKATFGKTDEEVAQSCRGIFIYHVHGRLGPLNWQTVPGESAWSRPYRAIENRDILQASKQINIAWERQKDTDTYGYMFLKDAILEASHIFFLGFGYHDDNMRFFRDILGKPIRTTAIIGTGDGLTSAQADLCSSRLTGLQVRHDSGRILQFLRSRPEVLSILKSSDRQ